MKLLKKIGLLLFVAGSAIGCTDGFEETNSDPNKLYEVNLPQIFPGTVYRTMQTISELNYNRMMSYSRYVTIVAYQGAWSDKGDGNYRKLYVEILRDWNAMEKKYAEDPAKPNSHAIVKTWKAFVYYQMLPLWGPVGLSDTGGLNEDISKRVYRYDSEESAYMAILDMLDVAVDLFDPSSSDKLSKDPVYTGGAIGKWRKVANTLRLAIAMNIQNINLETAREHVAQSMAHEDWIFSSEDYDLAPQY